MNPRTYCKVLKIIFRSRNLVKRYTFMNNQRPGTLSILNQRYPNYSAVLLLGVTPTTGGYQLCGVIPTTKSYSAVSCTPQSHTPQCPTHNGVLPTTESYSTVSYTPRSPTPQCPAHNGVILRSVLPAMEFFSAVSYLYGILFHGFPPFSESDSVHSPQ